MNLLIFQENKNPKFTLKIDSGAHISNLKKTYEIQTPIPRRVQPYKNYPIPMSKGPSNLKFSFLEDFIKI